MSTVTVTIDTDNAAFHEHGTYLGAREAARLLRIAADKVERSMLHPDSGPLLEANGNTVGEWRIT